MNETQIFCNFDQAPGFGITNGQTVIQERLLNSVAGVLITTQKQRDAAI